MIFSRLLVSVLLLGFVFLSSCSDDSVAASTSSGTMTATVNGTAYNGNFAAAASYKNGTLTVLGKDNTNQIISFSLFSIPGTGVYNLGPASMNIHSAEYFDATGVIWHVAQTIGSGSVNVTKLTSTDVEGTFNFVAEIVPGTAGSGTKTITNGAFSMKLTQ